jgi:hypothetical protein
MYDELLEMIKNAITKTMPVAATGVRLVSCTSKTHRSFWRDRLVFLLLPRSIRNTL